VRYHVPIVVFRHAKVAGDWDGSLQRKLQCSIAMSISIAAMGLTGLAWGLATGLPRRHSKDKERVFAT
jgi:hypothetical protein